MRRLALIAGFVGLAVTPASATEWINCSAASEAASFNLLVGSGGALSIAGLTITAGKAAWASDAAYGPGKAVSVGQAFEDSDTIRVDAVDANDARVAELRLFTADDADGMGVYGGTLRVGEQGVWPVSCSGP